MEELHLSTAGSFREFSFMRGLSIASPLSGLGESNSKQIESRVADSVTHECIGHHRPPGGRRIILFFRTNWREIVQNPFRNAEDVCPAAIVLGFSPFADKVLEP
jgi:hypothetical protein